MSCNNNNNNPYSACVCPSSVSSSISAMAAVTWKHFLEKKLSHLPENRKSAITKCLGKERPLYYVFFIYKIRYNERIKKEAFTSISKDHVNQISKEINPESASVRVICSIRASV